MAVAESQFKLLAQFPLKSKQRNWNPMSFASKITNNQIHEEGTFSFCRIFNGKSRALYLKLKDSTNNKTTSIGRSNWSEVRIMWKDPFWVKVFLLKLFAFRAYKSKSCRKQDVFDPSHIFHTLPLLHHSLQVQALKYSISDTQCWNPGSPWQAPWEPWPSSLWWRCGGSQRCSALRRSCRPVTEHC